MDRANVNFLSYTIPTIKFNVSEDFQSIFGIHEILHYTMAYNASDEDTEDIVWWRSQEFHINSYISLILVFNGYK